RRCLPLPQRFSAGLAVAFLALESVVVQAGSQEDWPEFRGPGGQGHSAARGLPTTWSETHNVAWKVPIPGRGWSSPVIRGRRVWLTTAVRDGRSLHALCLDRESGKLLHDVEVVTDNTPGT